MDQEHTEKQDCIQLCWQCRNDCQEALFTDCLQKGGAHVGEKHVKLMADCIQICQAAADFMTRKSELHEDVCGACASICDACADTCEEIGGEVMEDCAYVCRRCAKSCRAMSNKGPAWKEASGLGMQSGL